MSLAEAAEKFIEMRDKCAPLLPKTMLRDLSWDLMLELFLAAEHHQKPFIKQLSSIAGEPLANAQRRIDHLEGIGLIRRQRDEDDHRRVHLSLTEKGYTAIANMLRSLYDFCDDKAGAEQPKTFRPAVPNLREIPASAGPASRETKVVQAEFHATGASAEKVARDRFKAAIERGHIWPAFRPIVALRSNKIVGFEVLAHWTDPIEGIISPSVFIPQLERSDLVDGLSDFIVEQACASAKEWPKTIHLAFNISPTQLGQENLCERMSRCVSQHGFTSSRIEFEIAESIQISKIDAAQNTLTELDRRGFTIVIDDFGMGYSNLASLTSLPFSKMKIDAHFVRGIDSDPARRRMAAAVVSLAQNLGVAVIAEGVRTKAEEAVLKEFGCDFGQGWLYGKPMTAAEAGALLRVAGADRSPVRSLDTSPFQQLHQLDTLYEQAPVGLCLLDMDLRHVRANDLFARIHGLTGEELRGRSIEDVMQGETLETVREALREAQSSDRPVERQFRFGGRNVVGFNSRVKDIDGSIIGFSVVLIEVPDNPGARTSTALR